MASIKLEGSGMTPSVEFNEEEGFLQLKGRSIPENSIEFFKPLIDWVENYANNPKSETKVHIQLEYFNTSSSKCILDLFKKLENIRNTGHSVKVLWHYEEDDEDMMEAGEDYKAIINVPFEMIQIEEA